MILLDNDVIDKLIQIRESITRHHYIDDAIDTLDAIDAILRTVPAGLREDVDKLLNREVPQEYRSDQIHLSGDIACHRHLKTQ